MKNHLIKLAAIASLAGLATLPASAEHRDSGFAIRLGSAYIQFDDGYRYYDRSHQRRHNRRHRKQHRRQQRAHNSWHWRNDDRYDRYYATDHSYIHQDQRYRHRDHHRRQRRHSYRYW